MSFFAFITSFYTVLNLISLPVSNSNYFDLQNVNGNNIFEVKSENIDSQNKFPIKKSNDSLGVEISAKSAKVIDVKTGKTLWSKNSDDKRGIASITKLMTSIILFDAKNLDWNKEIEFTSEDATGDFNKLKLLPGDKVKFEDLFIASLLASSNSGIETLVKNSGMGREDFIKKMNDKANELGLKNTEFKDPTGLSNDNISTASEVIVFAQHAFSYQKIQDITSMKQFVFKPTNSDRSSIIKNTNNLIGSYLNIEAGKTGTTDDAGSCLISKISYDNKGPIIAVVLGSNSHFERFSDLKALASWVFENYTWK